MATLQIELRSPALIPALHTRQSQQQALCPSFSWAGLGGPGRPCSSVTAPTYLFLFMANFVVFLLSLYFFYFLLRLFFIVLHTRLSFCCLWIGIITQIFGILRNVNGNTATCRKLEADSAAFTCFSVPFSVSFFSYKGDSFMVD